MTLKKLKGIEVDFEEFQDILNNWKKSEKGEENRGEINLCIE